MELPRFRYGGVGYIEMCIKKYIKNVKEKKNDRKGIVK